MGTTAHARPLVVREGRILAYRQLDVADEIDLVAAERVIRAGGTRRGPLRGEAARSLLIASPPLEVALGEHAIALARCGKTLFSRISAHLFDYGAVSVSFEFPIEPGTPLGELVPVCDELYDSPELDRVARDLVPPLLERLGGIGRKDPSWEGIETYTVVYVRSFEGNPDAADVLVSPALVSLIVGEPPARRISAGLRADVLDHAHSYFADDLVVIDWDSAFVLEPSGSRDVPDILELASTQLLELRYYDGIFDDELARVHRELERAPVAGLLRNPWGPLGRRVMRRLVELTEFTERVDNALKVVGDFYLARVYESAVRRFHIRKWQESVDAKQALLAQAYGLVRDEIATRRSTALELIVILLIALELALALVHRG
jgi:hypothetical protein